MTKEEKIIAIKKEKNIKLYYIYKIFSFDLLFYYGVSFIFLSNFKGLTSAEIVFADSFYPFFKILFQVPATIITEKYGKKVSLVLGNMALVIYMLFILGCNSMQMLILADVFMAIGYVFKGLCESNIVYDSLPKNIKKRKAFSKIDGISSSLFYVFEAISCVVSGFLYQISPNLPIIICLICTIISLVLANFFNEVPEDITNPNEEHVHYKNFFDRMKKYRRNIKNAMRYILKSNRIRALIIYNAVFMSVIYLLLSYRRSLLEEIGLNSTQIGLIFGIIGLSAGLGSALTGKINKISGNKTLTYFGLYYTFSIIISGLVIILNLPRNVQILIITAMLAIQFFIKGPFYTLIKQYLSSFSSSSMRVKILSAAGIFEGIITGIFSFFGAFLLTKMSTAYASVIIGSISFIVIMIILEYMRPRVGLKPEEYKPSEINFKEVK